MRFGLLDPLVMTFMVLMRFHLDLLKALPIKRDVMSTIWIMRS